ncbi:DUF5667 domain-containing protein [Candidatus Oleimmundimicrobium sp.]|uniref:DUF5667 domain-containing protein n=1 Tax=Candidatus Oleimmundimicrobium sp. TaxID=3060597 RepID=UPI002725FABF|nr:DUF5667 domain-containing protein [Candidatus Oleimmundimicrobium sp.]MDO8886645.1 DUF5667 domain-containing protein [Candidatus Oleimmundimicrobium sp.]
MRKILTVFLVVSLFVMVFAPAVMAQDESVEPGLTPDSSFYFLKVWVEEFQLMFTFRAENKVELLNKFAEKRIAEAQKMIEKGKIDLAEKCLSRYEKHLNKTQSIIEKLGNEEVYMKVAEATSKHERVLNELLEKVPERARDSIEQAIEVSQTGHNRAGEALQKVLQKKIQIQEQNEGEETMIKTEQQTKTQTKECIEDCEEECEQIQERTEEQIKEQLMKDKETKQ